MFCIYSPIINKLNLVGILILKVLNNIILILMGLRATSNILAPKGRNVALREAGNEGQGSNRTHMLTTVLRSKSQYLNFCILSK